MLPPFIIDQIRRREEEEARKDDRPVLEIPVPPRHDPRMKDRKDPDEPQRGVIVIDLMG